MTKTSPAGVLRCYKPGSSCFRLSHGQSRAQSAPELAEWTDKLSPKAQKSLGPGDEDWTRCPAQPRASQGQQEGLGVTAFRTMASVAPSALNWHLHLLHFLKGDLG